MNQQDRAVTPVISTILVVAIVVILAATVSVAFLGITENITEPAPIVADTTGKFEAGAGGDDQIVRITHVAGDSIKVENIEIIVRASGPDTDLPTEARLVNLPGDGYFSRSLADQNIQGNKDLISQSFETDDQIIVVEDSNIWKAGDTIQFRIKKTGGADFSESPSGPRADKLEVVIVHTGSNSIISEHTFTT